MSAVMGTLSGFKAIPFNPAVMEKEEEKSNEENKCGPNHGSEENPEGLERENNCSSNSSSEDGDDDDPEDGDDEVKSKVEKEELDPGPQFSLKEQLEKDKDDESLRRWKEQLLGSVDINAVGENAEPEVQVQSLTILSPNRTNVVLPIPFVPNAKGHAFALKEESRYRLKFSFVVSNNIVSGLKYYNTVWKTGMRVDNRKVMLGTFSPQQEPYTYELEEDTTPSGIFARGSYSAKTKLVDDDGKCYLNIDYSFEIRKDWPSPS